MVAASIDGSRASNEYGRSGSSYAETAVATPVESIPPMRARRSVLLAVIVTCSAETPENESNSNENMFLSLKLTIQRSSLRRGGVGTIKLVDRWCWIMR